MKRLPSATRSYLHQLAEPVPHPAALVTPLRPAERGPSARSALDAIPPILDSISDLRAEAAAPQHQTANPTPHKGRLAQTPRSRALPFDASTQPQPTTEPDNSSQLASSTSTAARRDKRTASTTIAADGALPLPRNATRESRPSREPLARQENPSPPNEDRKQFLTQWRCDFHPTSASREIFRRQVLTNQLMAEAQ